MEQDLLWLLNDSSISQNNKPTSFLSILGRTYDEDLISRIIVYVMRQDRRFVASLLEKYSGYSYNIDECEIHVYPEKSMGIGRADIFAIIKKAGLTVATITVENKIYSYEHDDQTQTYYNWVLNQAEYKSAEINAFFYLHPGFNNSLAVCNKYQDLSYSEISELIIESNYIIKDFKNHIEQYLGEDVMELNEKQLSILENYEQIQKVLNETTSIYATIQSGIIDRVIQKIKQEDPYVKYESSRNSLGVYSVKLYKENWYKKDEYYFFTELFFDDGKLDSIHLRNVIKTYPRKSTEGHIQDFLKSDKIPIHSSDGRWFVWGYPKTHSSNHNWTEEKWKDEFVNSASKTLLDLISQTDAMVTDFLGIHK